MRKLFQSEGSVSNRALYVVSLNHFVNDSSTFLVASLFPAMELVFRFSILQIGVLVAIGYAINMVFQPLTGKLTQKYPPGLLLPAGILLIAASMFLFTLSGSYAEMILSVVILRLGSSFFHPIGALVVSRNYSGPRLDSAMGFESAFGNLGIVLAFMSSVPMYLALGWAGPFIIYAVLEAATIIITLLAFLARTEGFRKSGVDKGTGVHETADSAGNPKSGGDARYLLGIPLFFVVSSFISGGSNAIFGNFGNLLLYHSGFELGTSNDLMAIWVGSAFFGAIVSGWLARKLTRLRLLSIAYVISAAGSLAFALSSHILLIASLSLLVTGFTLSITYPAVYSELSVFVRGNPVKEGSSFGLLFSSQISGAAVLGFLSGYLATDFGLKSSFLIAAVLLILSVGAVYLWQRQTVDMPIESAGTQ